MSVYSYVELKVHANVQKVGTHLNVCLLYRTYVCWKYTFMFAYNNESSIYLYIMNIPLPLFHLSFPYLYYTIIYYIYIRETLFPALTFCPAPLFTFIYLYYIYTLYIERNILSRNFLLFSRPFLTLYYTPIIYRRGNTFTAPFYPSYKVNTFTPPFSLSFWNVTYGKSLRGKVFENFISIVL